MLGSSRGSGCGDSNCGGASGCGGDSGCDDLSVFVPCSELPTFASQSSR